MFPTVKQAKYKKEQTINLVPSNLKNQSFTKYGYGCYDVEEFNYSSPITITKEAYPLVVKMKKALILFMSFTLLCISMGIHDSVADAQPQEDIFVNEGFHELQTVLSAIEHIPDAVVAQGEEKTIEWLTQHTGMRVIVKEGNLQFLPKLLPSFNIPGCISAIGLAILTVGFPFTKILKVKKAIDALGGTVKFVKAFSQSYQLYKSYGYSTTTAVQKAIRSIGGSLKSDLYYALLDFFNINNILGNCT